MHELKLNKVSNTIKSKREGAIIKGLPKNIGDNFSTSFINSSAAHGLD